MTSPRIRVLLLTFVAFCCGASAATAEVDIRLRSDLLSPDKRVQYQMTEIIRLSDSEESNILLVRDTATNDRFVLLRRVSYADRVAIYRISDPKNEVKIEASFALQFSSRKRLEALQEARDNPLLSKIPTIVTIETNGGTWSGMDTTWSEWSELRRTRHDIRRATSFYLLEGIERMRDSVFAQTVGQAFYQIVGRFVVYDNDKEDAGLTSLRAMPSCDFDKSFGFPCTAKQQTRVKDAVEKGQIPERY